MAPVTEIAIFPLKSTVNVRGVAGQTRTTVWEGILNTVLEQDGVQRAYWGLEENPSKLRLFVDWDSLDDHKKFMQSDIYKPMLERLKELLDGEPQLYHTTFTPHPPSAALSDTNSPVTEIFQVKFAPNLSSADKDLIEKDIKDFVAVLEQHADQSTGSAGGWVIEDEKETTYIGCIGWQSIDAHMAFRETQPFKDNIHLLRELKGRQDINMVHATLTEVQPGGPSSGRDIQNDVQEEVLNPREGEKIPPKTRADGTTTKHAR